MKKIRNAIGFVVLIALVSLSAQYGIERARAAFWQWSQTASANGNSDPSISWIEGMPPSVVNDSARAMMARLAEQAADTSGALQATGGPTAFAVTTNQGFPSPPNDGQVIGLTFNVNSAGSPTLAVDGGAAESIVSTPGTPANLTAGVPTIMLYQAASSSWIVRSGGGGGIMLGGIIAYTGTTPPPNYVMADGQCISTTTYATYWALVGSPAPGYCGAGQFAVIDLRGYVLAGLDTMPGSSAANRLTTATTGCGTAMTTIGAVCANGAENRTMTVAQMPTHYHYAGIRDPGHHHDIGFGIVDYAVTDVVGYYTVNAATGSYFTANSYTGIHVNTPDHGDDYTANAGGSQPHPAVQPTIGVNYIIRVL